MDSVHLSEEVVKHLGKILFACLPACKQRDLQKRFFVIRCQKRREVYGPKESADTGHGAADAG